MNLVEIMSIDEWIELEGDINRMSGLNSAVYDIAGRRVTEFTKWSNSLCPAIRKTGKGLKFICSIAHQNIAAQAAKTRKTIIAECDAGMMKFAVPIFIDGEFLGVAGGCGKLRNGSEIDTYLINRTAGLSENSVSSFAKSVKPISDDRLTGVIDYLERKVAKMIQDQRGMSTLRSAKAI